VAVKHLQKAVISSDVIHEVTALAKLNHPSVLRIVGWHPAEASTGAEIWTEYASNGPIHSLLRGIGTGKIPPFWDEKGLGIVICGIVLGLRYVHFSGVIHGDVKPSNILLNANGHPLIGDFGSSYLDSDQGTPTRPVTIHYSFPEHFDEGAVRTPKSDVFSFGLVLYELVVGRPVFSASIGPLAVIKRLLARDLPTVPTRCGLVMADLIRRCWFTDPNDRPSFDEILSEFRFHNFNILPNAVATEIEDFCEAILDWERGAGIAH
jgi:serine/threonine protein kinase